MCGIAGAVRRGGLAPEALSAMARALAHRGPDGEGTVRAEPISIDGDRWQAGLAHRRLAVLDPSAAGAQPMTTRSGRISLVLNGEIYNYLELRRRLPGFPWRTGTDTEVLAELFEREGARVLEHANGMFAFAVWDHERHRLLLARDRLGIKPLFYRADKDGVVFASELRSLLAGPAFERRLDPDAVSAYLDFGFVPAPRTILSGVAKLAPGALLEWSDGESQVKPWWRLPVEAALADAPEAGWREGLYTRLLDAVRIQLRSDVPVGCFLSGGIDSTLLAALAMRERGTLDTFSLAFPDQPRFDESAAAERTARTLGTRHRVVPMRTGDIAREGPSILSTIDEPFADSSLLPVHLLSRGAREHVTVALTGDGADELFAGYRRYSADRWLGRWRRLPAGLRRGIEPLLRRIPDDRTATLGELARRARKVLDADGMEPAARQFAMARVFDRAWKLRLAPALAEHVDSGYARLCDERDRQGGRDGLDHQLRVDLALGLPDDMLTKVDRASMAYGLEVRVPYLDHRFVEHVVRMPSRLKQRGRRSKVALLDVFGASIPRDVRRRPKAGFDAPLSDWLRGPLRGLTRDTLAPGTLRRTGLLEPAAVDRLLSSHERGEADHAWRIWSLVVLCDWSARVGLL